MGKGMPETYWKSGFTVEGSTDTIVELHCRSEKEATQKAYDEAEKMKNNLTLLGVPATIKVWTEKWQTWRETKEFARSFQTELIVARPSENRRLYEERDRSEAVRVEVK